MTSSSDLRTPVSRRPDVPAAAAAMPGLVVVEGMPGAGKTTALAALAEMGHHVLGEYTDDHARPLDLASHPHHDDEAPHLANWLRKDTQAAGLARTGTVIADRNWLTALGWAASVNDLDNRATWAHAHLTTGGLTLPRLWIILDCRVGTSLARRRDRLDPSHPWADPGALHRLRTFYADPVLTVAAVLPELAALISPIPVARVDAEMDKHDVGRAIAEALT